MQIRGTETTLTSARICRHPGRYDNVVTRKLASLTVFIPTQTAPPEKALEGTNIVCSLLCVMVPLCYDVTFTVGSAQLFLN